MSNPNESLELPVSTVPQTSHVAVTPTFADQLRYRGKAVATAIGGILEAAAIAVISDPSTEKAIEQVVPQPYQVLAALVFGAIVTAVVHQVKVVPLPGRQ